jgi:hypothetical protein
MRAGELCRLVCFVALLALSTMPPHASQAQTCAGGGVCVTTWHNDNLRTGQNTAESQLTTALVGNPDNFGKICSASLSGFTYTQPLVVPSVTISGTMYTYVVYVATMDDMVYAIDGTNCNILLSQSLLESGEEPMQCKEIGNCTPEVYNEVGVMGTPVIDLSAGLPESGTMFVVAASECAGCGTGGVNLYYHRLWALNISTLSNVTGLGSPVQICASGCGGSGAQQFSLSHYQRPGLLELPLSETGSLGVDMVYIAFSMIDGNGNFPSGFIFGYDADNLAATGYPLIYDTTPGVPGASGLRGGIWQGGAGLAAAADTPGGSNYYIYTSTGDGTYDLNSTSAPNQDSADSTVKLTPSLTYPSGAAYSVYSYTPSDSQWRACNDMDYGSAGIMLLPDSSAFSRSYAIKADKENYLWTIYRDNLGGYTGYSGCGTCSYPNGVGCANGTCTACTVPNNPVEPPIPVYGMHGDDNNMTRSAPAFWSASLSSGDVGELYFAGTTSQLLRYPINPSCSTPPVCSTPAASTNVDPSGSALGYAATPSISSNTASSGYENGIAWAIKSNAATGDPVLYAFEAGTLTELYDTEMCEQGSSYPDQPGTPTRFSVPTVANGYVYLATETDFDIYGQLAQPRTCN